ncbi:MAG: Calx-beta domain-containing protein [Paracoccaceae bacterium]|nr:Calx-beta domain-containing protein [Paracoccaceae bacterium]MDG1371147.1 Calx-beta domain-containing protein [Paracoccaceae bacterium]
MGPPGPASPRWGGQVTGSVFTNLGDIDADGEDELFLGSPFATSPEGGQASGLGFIFTPSGDGATDFATSPTGLETTFFGDALTFLAEDAAGVGDVNGDGLGDFLLQEDGANTDAPLFYLVYGSNDGFSSTFDISTQTSERVSTFGGVSASSAASGIDMAGVGDVNGDGFDDILLSHVEGGPLGAGEAAMLFGSATGFGASVDLNDIADGAGYRFQGTDYSQRVGYAVTGPGDLNGDGMDDFAIGAKTFNPPGNADYTFDAPGAVFVIYGGAAALEALDQQSGDDGVISLDDVTGVVDIPDDTPTVFSLGGDLEVSEGALGFNVVVTRSSGEGAAEFDLSFSGSATSQGENADFTRVIGQTNTFEDGETSKLITFTIEQDAVREPDENVEVELSITSADQPATLGDTFQTVTILDNDEPTVFSLGADFSVSEAEGADRTFAITVTRSSGVGAAEVELTPTGSATSADFSRIGGSDVFADGETTTSVLYRVETDTLSEGDETISFALDVLSSDQLVLFDDATQVVTIEDDDDPVVYSLAPDFEISEGALGFNIFITRSSNEGEAEIALRFNGSAISGGANPDFARIGGTNVFADGETEKLITFRIEHDVLQEPNERIFFQLDVTSADRQTLVGDAFQTVTILDNDEPTVFSLGADFSVSETDSADRTFTITVTRSSVVGAAEISLTPTGNAGSADFSRIGGSNTFADGETSTSVIYRVEADTLA